MRSFSNSESKPDKGYSSLNFIWIGPPASNEKNAVIGHDILAVKKMAISNQSNPIFFWCLDQHLKYYQAQFLGTRIACRAIEPYLQHELTQPTKDLAAKMIEIQSTLLSADRNRKRDRTTVKVAFSYFLLYQSGGYVLDTNVFPKADKLELPAYDRLMMPRAEGEITKQDNTSLDVWMMYAPAKFPAIEKIFLEFYLKWKEHAEKLYQSEGYSSAYHDEIVNAILGCIDFSGVHNETIGTWVSQGASYSVSTGLDIGVEKQRYNTHRHWHKGLYEGKEIAIKDNLHTFFSATNLAGIPNVSTIIQDYLGDDIQIQHQNMIFQYIAEGNVEMLREMILHGADLSQRLDGAFKGTEATPLHYAVLKEMKAAEDGDEDLVQKIAFCRKELKDKGAPKDLSAFCKITYDFGITKTAGELDKMWESGQLDELVGDFEASLNDYYTNVSTPRLK